MDAAKSFTRASASQRKLKHRVTVMQRSSFLIPNQVIAPLAYSKMLAKRKGPVDLTEDCLKPGNAAQQSDRLRTPRIFKNWVLATLVQRKSYLTTYKGWMHDISVQGN